VVLVSSHIPFSPVPPLILLIGTTPGHLQSVSETARKLRKFYLQPDLSRLRRYLKSLGSDLAALEGWLSTYARDGLVIALAITHASGPLRWPARAAHAPCPIHLSVRGIPTSSPRFHRRGESSRPLPAQKPPYRCIVNLPCLFLSAFDHLGGASAPRRAEGLALNKLLKNWTALCTASQLLPLTSTKIDCLCTGSDLSNNLRRVGAHRRGA